ncbi:MAG: TlpA disulfide reductase family protein [Acidobacteriota bacterium]
MVRWTMAAAMILTCSSLVLGQTKDSAVQLVIRDIGGRPIRLSDYRGKVVLLNFWATWCAPCLAEIPDLVKWQRDYGSRGLRVIGITQPPERREEVRRFARRLKVNYPIAIGRRPTRLQFERGETMPITVLIDRRGIVREVIEGVVFPEEFEEKVKPRLIPIGRVLKKGSSGKGSSGRSAR